MKLREPTNLELTARHVISTVFEYQRTAKMYLTSVEDCIRTITHLTLSVQTVFFLREGIPRRHRNALTTSNPLGQIV